MLLVVFSPFAADGGLTHTDLLSDIALSLFLVIERLNKVSLCQGQSLIGCHYFDWFSHLKATEQSMERLTFVGSGSNG